MIHLDKLKFSNTGLLHAKMFSSALRIAQHQSIICDSLSPNSAMLLRMRRTNVGVRVNSFTSVDSYGNEGEISVVYLCML